MGFWTKIKSFFTAPAPVSPRAHPLARPLEVAIPILPVRGFVDGDPRERIQNYLSSVREDSLLDGLIGSSCGDTGGGWKNPVTGHGTFGRDKVMQGLYAAAKLIDWNELSDLYNGNDLAKRIVETVPKEVFRRGYVLVVPQESDASDDAGPSDDALEQPAGGESGPAAPGSPLVDPIGASPDNATAKLPQDGGGAQARSPEVAPPAQGAAISDPMGENLSRPKPSISAGADAMTPTSDRKPSPRLAPSKRDKAGAGAKGAATDQNKGADLALAAESYAKRLGLKARFLEGYIFGRLFGGGLVIIGADDGQDMAEPLNMADVRTVRYLSWIDRRFAFANSWYAEIGPKFGEVQTGGRSSSTHSGARRTPSCTSRASFASTALRSTSSCDGASWAGLCPCCRRRTTCSGNSICRSRASRTSWPT